MEQIKQLEFRNVSYENQNQETILKNISISIEQGDYISIIGPSGSGKSTFLKLCSYLISPTKGEILFKKQNMINYDPTELRKNISYCFQTPYLFGDTVLENIKFPFIIRNLPFVPERTEELFDLFQISMDFLNKEVKHLSGGEKQRIALIRNLIFPPEILLLDEVTSALDEVNTAIVEDILLSLNREGMTILWVTHDLEQSKRYADKRLLIEAGQIKSLEVIR